MGQNTTHKVIKVYSRVNICNNIFVCSNINFLYLFQLFSGSWRCYHFASYIIKFLHCFVMKGSSRNKFIHTISLSTFHVKKTSPFHVKTIHQPNFFALYNIKRYKKRNTFLPLIMHSNITLMKKE